MGADHSQPHSPSPPDSHPPSLPPHSLPSQSQSQCTECSEDACTWSCCCWSWNWPWTTAQASSVSSSSSSGASSAASSGSGMGSGSEEESGESGSSLISNNRIAASAASTADVELTRPRLPSPSPSPSPLSLSLASRAAFIRSCSLSSLAWRTLLDPPTQRPFYFHTITAETTWLQPPPALYLSPLPQLDSLLYGSYADVPMCGAVCGELEVELVCVEKGKGKWRDSVYGERIGCQPPGLIPLRIYDRLLSGELELYLHPVARRLLQYQHKQSLVASNEPSRRNGQRNGSHPQGSSRSDSSSGGDASGSSGQILRRIVLCSHLSYGGQRRGAIPVSRNGTLYLDVETKEAYYMQDVIQHELFHMIDLYIMKELQLQQQQQQQQQQEKQEEEKERACVQVAASNAKSSVNTNDLPDPLWCALNPPGFQYGSGGAQSRQKSMFLSGTSGQGHAPAPTTTPSAPSALSSSSSSSSSSPSSFTSSSSVSCESIMSEHMSRKHGKSHFVFSLTCAHGYNLHAKHHYHARTYFLCTDQWSELNDWLYVLNHHKGWSFTASQNRKNKASSSSRQQEKGRRERGGGTRSSTRMGTAASSVASSAAAGGGGGGLERMGSRSKTVSPPTPVAEESDLLASLAADAALAVLSGLGASAAAQKASSPASLSPLSRTPTAPHTPTAASVKGAAVAGPGGAAAGSAPAIGGGKGREGGGASASTPNVGRPPAGDASRLSITKVAEANEGEGEEERWCQQVEDSSQQLVSDVDMDTEKPYEQKQADPELNHHQLELASSRPSVASPLVVQL